MHSANLTTATIKRISGLIIAVLFSAFSYAQDNSPYSRYGIGDFTPNRNVISRGMGGITAGYSDYQTINLNNPAALSSMVNTIFDLGGDIDIRTLKSNTNAEKSTSTNTIISYLQVAFPITPKKMLNKGNYWGVSFGLKPYTNVGYKIQQNTRVTNIDSLSTTFEGTGGLSQANVSTGFRIKNLSLGVSGGYTFGNTNYNTRKTLVNDSVIYYKSNSASQTRLGGIFVTVGAQYDIKLKGASEFPKLTIGAYANLEQSLRARRNQLSETYTDDGNGGTVPIDTVSIVANQKGTLKIPATYSAGFTYTDLHWIVGADLDLAKWDDYLNYGQKDASLTNSYTIRAGAQYYAATDKTPATKYWSFVKYRAGIYYGNDYVKIAGDKARNNYGVTLGASLPLTSLQRNAFAFYREGLVTLNTGVEFGVRGDKQSQSLRENVTRISIGISMNARWFQRVKYQ